MVEFDAVYPYHGVNHYEISVSIELLRKNVHGLRNIYVIGDDPGIDGVIVIPFVQTNAKEVNIWKKTLTACFTPEISEKFLFMNDDHFILKKIGAIPYYYEGELGAHGGTKQYNDAEQRTILRLLELNKPVKYFDIHCPMFIEKAKFKQVFEHFSDAEYLMKSAYCNYWGIFGEQYTDQKFRTLVTYDEAAAAARGRWVISSSELTMTIGLKKYLQECLE